MSLTALRHDDHGVHIAYSDAEVKACIELGWSKDLALSRELSGSAPVDKSLVDKYKEKFGKPPHHRMTEKSIQDALDAD